VNFCTKLLVLCRNKSLVDAAIEHVLKQRRTDAVPVTGGLTFVDIFYREVVNTAEWIFFLNLCVCVNLLVFLHRAESVSI